MTITLKKGHFVAVDFNKLIVMCLVFFVDVEPMAFVPLDECHSDGNGGFRDISGKTKVFLNPSATHLYYRQKT